jgi:hypothetical protein
MVHHLLDAQQRILRFALRRVLLEERTISSMRSSASYRRPISAHPIFGMKTQN